MSPPLTYDELLHEALVLPMRSFIPLPDTQIIDRPGFLQVITPSLKRGGLNQVIFSALDEGEAERVIDETIAMYRAQGVRFRWTLLPGSRPDDLAERLARRGLKPVDIRAMYRETEKALELAQSDEIRVEDVSGSNVDIFTDAMAMAWGMASEPLRAFHRRLIERPARDYRLFLAYYRDRPAGGASYTSFSRSVYLVGGAVHPEYRGKGVYRALVDARLRAAAASGRIVATTQAQVRSSAPILERLGFETLCAFPVYADEE